MNLFDTVKAAVTPRMAAERYGLPIQQGSMICCPFHADRTPSMKLNEDYFYCFGCGASGDVIDLAASSACVTFRSFNRSQMRSRTAAGRNTDSLLMSISPPIPAKILRQADIVNSV